VPAHPKGRWSLDLLAESFGPSRKFFIRAAIHDCRWKSLIADISISGDTWPAR